MEKTTTILVTGAAGFIGSCMVSYLNQQGFHHIIIVDEFETESKVQNYCNKNILHKVHRNELYDWLKNNPIEIGFVFHLGARTDTTEFNYAIHEELNVEYSKKIWNYCVEKNIPLVYASSAATYGGGELGYQDDHDFVEKLQPLNPYGISKNEFDKWVLIQKSQPPFWAGLKFFNVYGPNEYHKGRMASVVFHAFEQIKNSGKVKLFKSHHTDFKDGEQLRDFIYVMDVVNICFWMMENIPANGLYNVGSGKARTFNDLVAEIFKNLDTKEIIEYVNTPEDIRDRYQYFTEASMTKLKNAGYKNEFHSLEEGVKSYVNNFLKVRSYY